jgi:hypothetical protein
MKLLQASFCASAACLALATLGLAATAPAFAQDAFKVGLVTPMSGANARYGAFANKGAALAAKEVNAAGGVMGKKLEFVSGDSQCVPAEGVSATKRMISFDKLPVIIGDICSSVTLAMQPLAEESNVLLINAASSNPMITYKAGVGGFKWSYRNYPTDEARAAIVLEHSVKNRGLKNFAVLSVDILTDDIYEHIRFDGEETPHLLRVETGLRDRTVLINGVSKTYAMTGWRIGYAAGPSDIIAALDMLQSQSTSNASSVSQAAALAALKSEANFLPGWVQTYKERRDRALELINAIPGLSCRTPGGAFYLYINCGGLMGRRTSDGRVLETDNDVVMYFLESAGVAVVSGSSYGSSPYFRISIATSLLVIEAACTRMRVAVEALRA